MKRFTVLCVGKTSKSYYREACLEYSKRIGHFYKLEFVELDEKGDLKKEAQLILKNLKPGYNIVLDKDGKSYSSESFAKVVSSCLELKDNLNFIIGSHEGIDQSIKDSADMLLSFGAATLPHQLAKVVLLEQLYRALTINFNLPYHK